MAALYWIDCVIVGIIGLSIITGLFRGFVKELIALGVWALAIWLAATWSQTASIWIQPYFADKTACIVVAFVIILVATLISGAIVNSLISMILHRSGLSGIDRLLGMGFGFVRGVFIVALLMLVVKMTSLPTEEYRKESRLYAQFDPLVDWIYGYTPDVIKKIAVFDKIAQGTDIEVVGQMA